MSNISKSNAIVISGMGCISAAGLNVEEHFQSLQNSYRNCQQVPGWLFKTKHRYPVFLCPQDALTAPGKDLLNSLGKSSAKDLSRTAQLMISASAEALSSAGLGSKDLKGKRLGIAIGTTVGCTFNDQKYYKSYKDGETPNPKPFLDYLNGNLAYSLHTLFGTNGPSLVITNACASGTDAIGIAGAWLTAGYCDIAIAGGADELSKLVYNGFISLQLTDSSPCRPFDQTRQGLNLGEGAGIVVMEREQDAIKRNSVVGWLRGYGSCSDAWHPTAPNPEGKGLVRAVNLAKKSAKITVPLALINAHGTGTKANDSAEANALLKIVEDQKGAAVVSTKGWTGHTLGAAGAIEAIFTLISLKNRVAWGTLGCKNVDSDCRVEICSEDRQLELHGNIGLSQSLAFGGCNSALILEANI